MGLALVITGSTGDLGEEDVHVGPSTYKREDIVIGMTYHGMLQSIGVRLAQKRTGEHMLWNVIHLSLLIMRHLIVLACV
jgi:hypothetical protein